MKVLFAHDHVFLRDAGGRYYTRGQYPYELWRQYLAVFHSVTVASRVGDLGDGAWENTLNLASGPNVSFVAVPPIRVLTRMLYRRVLAARILGRELAAVDALIARLPSETGLLAVQVARRLGKPWAVEVTGCARDVLWYYGNLAGKIYAPLYMLRTRNLVRRAPFVLYVTGEFLQSRYPCRGHVLGCSDVMLPEVDSRVLEMRLDALREGRRPVRIGLIGSLNARYKGIQTALLALRKAGGSLPPFEFRILGGGDDRPWRKLAAENGLSRQTFFCGTLPAGPAVEQWLDGTDIYIQPSFTEGLPRALLEAMSRGCPALGSTAGGIPELLDRDCLHQPGDSDRLAELLVSAMDQKWQGFQARRNFQEARKYAPALLKPVRENFWREFAGALEAGK